MAEQQKPKSQEIFEQLVDWSLQRMMAARKTSDDKLRTRNLRGAINLLKSADSILREADPFKWIRS